MTLVDGAVHVAVLAPRERVEQREPLELLAQLVEREEHTARPDDRVEHRVRPGMCVTERRAGTVVAVGRLGQVQDHPATGRQHPPDLVPVFPAPSGWTTCFDEDVQRRRSSRPRRAGRRRGRGRGTRRRRRARGPARSPPRSGRPAIGAPATPRRRVATRPAAHVEPARPAQTARERPDHRAGGVRDSSTDPRRACIPRPTGEARSCMKIQPAIATKCRPRPGSRTTWKSRGSRTCAATGSGAHREDHRPDRVQHPAGDDQHSGVER